MEVLICSCAAVRWVGLYFYGFRSINNWYDECPGYVRASWELRIAHGPNPSSEWTASATFHLPSVSCTCRGVTSAPAKLQWSLNKKIQQTARLLRENVHHFDIAILMVISAIPQVFTTRFVPPRHLYHKRYSIFNLQKDRCHYYDKYAESNHYIPSSRFRTETSLYYRLMLFPQLQWMNFRFLQTRPEY